MRQVPTLNSFFVAHLGGEHLRGTFPRKRFAGTRGRLGLSDVLK